MLLCSDFMTPHIMGHFFQATLYVYYTNNDNVTIRQDRKAIQKSFILYFSFIVCLLVFLFFPLSSQHPTTTAKLLLLVVLFLTLSIVMWGGIIQVDRYTKFTTIRVFASISHVKAFHTPPHILHVSAWYVGWQELINTRDKHIDIFKTKVAYHGKKSWGILLVKQPLPGGSE